MSEAEIEGWRGSQRTDRSALVLKRPNEDTWMVVSRFGPPIIACPRCKKRLQSERAAKRVADDAFPRAAEAPSTPSP